MNNNKVMNKGGYQPGKANNGYQPSLKTPATTIKVTPPKGGSGETVLKKK